MNDPSDDSLDFLTPLVLVLIMHYANLMVISDAFTLPAYLLEHF